MKIQKTNTKANLLKTLLLLSLISLAFSGLVFPGKKIPILPEDTVIESTNPNTRRLSANVPLGRRLIIKLKGNMESGKGWYLRNFCKANRELLAPQNLNSFNCGEFVSTQDECGRITGDGFYYFIFKPKKEGKVTLNFAYRAPFQWDSPKNAQFEVAVRVMRNAFDDDGNDPFGAFNADNAKGFKRNYKTFERKQKGFKSPMESVKPHKFRNYQHKYKCEFDNKKDFFDF